jgi:hypothetical protein
MQGLRLPAHIHYGRFGEERIFLDLETDRYFQLAAESEAVFEALEQGAFAPASGCAKLVDEGLLGYAPDGRPIRPAENPEPVGSLVERAQERASFGLLHVIEIAGLLMAARWTVRRRHLARLKSGGPIRSSRAGEFDHAVRQFLSARKYVPLAPNCLRDSLALRSFLLRRGLEARLIVGAKLHPFAAHCWLQHEGLVLNDSLSAAKGFAPVLVL